MKRVQPSSLASNISSVGIPYKNTTLKPLKIDLLCMCNMLLINK